MIPVVLSTVKIHFVHFSQKNRRNSLLKVAVGVILEVFSQYSQTCLRTDAKEVDAESFTESVNAFIFLQVFSAKDCW